VLKSNCLSIIPESEHGNLTAVEKIVEDVVASTEFQAFADYADYVAAADDLRRVPGDALFQLRYCLINETRRKRENREIGYKIAFSQATELRAGISVAEDAKRRGGKPATELRTHRGYIKHSIIDLPT